MPGVVDNLNTPLRNQHSSRRVLYTLVRMHCSCCRRAYSRMEVLESGNLHTAHKKLEAVHASMTVEQTFQMDYSEAKKVLIDEYTFAGLRHKRRLSYFLQVLN